LHCNTIATTIAIGKTYNELFCWCFIRLLARINKYATRAQQKRNIVAKGVAMVVAIVKLLSFCLVCIFIRFFNSYQCRATYSKLYCNYCCNGIAIKIMLLDRFYRKHRKI
jgi:hypothetical protein